MIEQLKIGPVLTICNRDTYLPNMVDAFLADNERGSHQWNNEAAEKLKQEWPTFIEMANLIEYQRDLLVKTLEDMLEFRWTHENDRSKAREVLLKIKQGQY